MYELLVLSALLTGSESVYKLRKIMEDTFSVRRSLSNGVLYPLLKELESKEYVIITKTENRGRRENKVSLTKKGQERIHDLLNQPIKADINREEMLHLKLTLIGIELPEKQYKFYSDYVTYFEEMAESKRNLKNHLTKKYDGVIGTERIIDSTLSSIDLDIELAETKIRFANQKIKELRK